MEKKELFYGFSEVDLDGYVRRTLSKDTLAAMERAIQQHEALKAELVRRIHLYRIRTNPSGLLWLAQLKSQPPAIPNVSKANWVKIGAFITILAILTGAFWLQTAAKKRLFLQTQRLQTRIEMVQKALESLPDRDVFGKNTPNGIINQALEYYRNKQYEQAEPFFTKALTVLQGEEEVPVYISICRLHTGHYKEARRILETVQTDEKSDVQAAIRWYSSLSLLTEIEPEALEKAQQYLQSVADLNEYQIAATELLKSLKN
jgi:tetratricopeptide (TPR) repeat protein